MRTIYGYSVVSTTKSNPRTNLGNVSGLFVHAITLTGAFFVGITLAGQDVSIFVWRSQSNSDMRKRKTDNISALDVTLMGLLQHDSLVN